MQPVGNEFFWFHCYCKDLIYQQAQVLLKQGHTYLDRDGDGEACENLK